MGETEIPWDSIQNEVATIGTAKPIEIGKPVAMADVAVPSGPAGTGAGGPVATEISMTTVTDRTEASGSRRRVTDAPVATGLCSQTGNDRTEAGGPAITITSSPVGIVRKFRTAGETTETEMATGTGTGGMVVTGTQFLAVAEVHAPIAEREGNQWSEVRNSDQITEVTTEMTSPTQLEHISSGEDFVVETDGRGNSMAEDGTKFLKPEVIREHRTRNQLWSLAVTHQIREWRRSIQSTRKLRQRGTRLWLGWWGRRHPGSSRDGLMMWK